MNQFDATHLESEEFHLIHLPAFLELYKRRPLEYNPGGMQINHSYALYCFLKSLSPELVVESGVWRGISTWLIENTLPSDRSVICLDPVLSNRHYISRSAVYSEHDFGEYDWSSMQTRSTLCIFDDHQSSLMRLMQMKWLGFTRCLFEDNYPSGKGDFYTLNQILDCTGHEQIQLNPKEYSHLSIKSKLARYLEQLLFDRLIIRRFYSSQSVIRRANTSDRVSLLANTSFLYTFPCLVRLQDLPCFSNHSPKPLLTPSLFHRYPSLQELILSFIDTHSIKPDPGFFYYNNITYVELSTCDSVHKT